MDLDSNVSLKTYLGSPKWMRIVTYVLLAATIVFIIAGTSVLSKDVDQSTAIEFYPGDDEMKRKYVYLDVEGISDYVAYKDSEKWYVALDPEGFAYVVKLRESQFLSLKAHNDWWNSDEEYDIEPTRIYGMTAKISNELADVIKDVFEFESRDEVFNIFGKYLLNATQSPNEGPGGFLIFLALMSLAGFIAFLTINATKNNTVKRSIKRLEQLGLTEQAEQQLNSPLTEVIGNDMTRITQDFICCKPNGAIVPISDILWMYGHIQRYNGVKVFENLNACTKTGKTYVVCNAEKKAGTDSDSFTRIMEIIREKNPDIMLGYSLENQKEYKRLCKEEKNGINA